MGGGTICKHSEVTGAPECITAFEPVKCPLVVACVEIDQAENVSVSKPLKMAEVSCTVQAFEILYGAR